MYYTPRRGLCSPSRGVLKDRGFLSLLRSNDAWLLALLSCCQLDWGLFFVVLNTDVYVARQCSFVDSDWSKENAKMLQSLGEISIIRGIIVCKHSQCTSFMNKVYNCVCSSVCYR